MTKETLFTSAGQAKTERSPTNTSAWKKKRALVIKEETHCHICLEEVDKTLKKPDPMAPQVDHITPSALGGDDSRSNLSLCHAICNQKRSTKPLDEVRAIPAPSQKWF